MEKSDPLHKFDNHLQKVRKIYRLRFFLAENQLPLVFLHFTLFTANGFFFLLLGTHGQLQAHEQATSVVYGN